MTTRDWSAIGRAALVPLLRPRQLARWLVFASACCALAYAVGVLGPHRRRQFSSLVVDVNRAIVWREGRWISGQTVRFEGPVPRVGSVDDFIRDQAIDARAIPGWASDAAGLPEIQPGSNSHVVAVGWPVPFSYFVCMSTDADDQAWDQRLCIQLNIEDHPVVDDVFGPTAGRLPYGILWRGLLIDLGTFMLVPMFLVAARRAVVSRRRLSLGLCAECGYPRGKDAARCSECGNALGDLT